MAAPLRVRARDGDDEVARSNNKHARRAEPESELRVECRYRNDLPKPPVPKLLRALPSVEKLAQYKPTSLEIEHRPVLLSAGYPIIDRACGP